MITCPKCQIGFSPGLRVCPKCGTFKAPPAAVREEAKKDVRHQLEMGESPGSIVQKLVEAGISRTEAETVVSSHNFQVMAEVRTRGRKQIVGSCVLLILALAAFAASILVGLAMKPRGLVSAAALTSLFLVGTGKITWAAVTGIVGGIRSEFGFRQDYD